MTNKELIQRFEVLVAEEKKATRLVLEHIALIESRRAYFDLGYDGMYAYMVNGLGYSEGAAHRRIMASRALKVDASIGEKLEQGTLNLTQLAQVTQLSRATKTQTTLELFEKIENQGKSATEQILAERFDIKPKEFTRTKTQQDESVRVEVTFSKEQFAALEKARIHLSHVCPEGDWAQVLTELANRLNKKMEGPAKSKTPSAELKANLKLTPSLDIKPQRKQFGLPLKRILLRKAQGHCQHRDQVTGRRCHSTYQLQIDHIFPVSRGGIDSVDNIQILCGAHNRHKSDKLFGFKALTESKHRPR